MFGRFRRNSRRQNVMGGRGAASGAANGMALGRKMSVSKFLENLKKTMLIRCLIICQNFHPK